jgi:hypothetical protein
MELSSKEIRDIGIATAQHVLEGLHRYTVDYVPPSSVQQALRDSMVEEKTAQDWYAKRFKYCQSVGDVEVGKALYGIMKDEEDHYRIESELLAKRTGGKPDKKDFTIYEVRPELLEGANFVKLFDEAYAAVGPNTNWITDYMVRQVNPNMTHEAKTNLYNKVVNVFANRPPQSQGSRTAMATKGITKGCCVIVAFFDSMTMKNRVEKGLVIDVRSDNEVVVEVEKPIRKRVTVPMEYVMLCHPEPKPGNSVAFSKRPHTHPVSDYILQNKQTGKYFNSVYSADSDNIDNAAVISGAGLADWAYSWEQYYNAIEQKD